MSSPQQSPLPCIIKDFCKTGLFIAFEDDQPKQQPPLNVNDVLFIDYKSSGALQLNYRLHVRVVRIMEHAIGVEITHNNPEAIYTLYKLAKEPATIKPSANQRDFTEVQEKCRQLVAAFVSSSDRFLFTAIHDVLIEKARQASDNTHETFFVDIATRFKKYHDRISRIFNTSLLQQVDNWLEGKPISLPESASVEKQSRLSLVEKEAFEDWLLVKVVINKADRHYKNMLFDLQLRMTELSGVEINHKNNPLNPAYISHAFYQAITPMALPRKAMQAVLQAFESQIIVKDLKRLYVMLNELFIENDILPVIIYNPLKSEQSAQDTSPAKPSPNSAEITPPTTPALGLSPAVTPVLGALNATSISANTSAENISSMQTLAAVQNLISLQQPKTTNLPSNTNAEILAAQQLIATDQLLSQLTQLQITPATQTKTATQQPLHERLAQCLGGNKKLSAHDNTAVEVTEKFFGSMGGNKHLSDTIKPIFKQLEIPLLKVFIQDESFFEDANHPARRVLNRLAKLGFSGDQLSQKNTQKVEQAIEKIAQDFDQDTHVFNTAAAELDELIIKQEAAAQRNTERLVKSCDGLETIEKGKYTVRQFIEQQLNGRKIPKVLAELVNNGWRELLVFTLLRDGQGSAIWKSYANVVKSLSLISADTDLSVPHQQGAGLIKIVDIGINEAPGGQTQMRKLRPALVDLLSPDSDSGTAEFVDADSLLASLNDAFSYIDDEAVQSKALSRWVRRARNLKIGSWIEYGENKSAPQMRLAWIGQDHHKFVFVNHQGMKVIELSLREMAEHLQSGHATLIDDPDAPFVDQNLDTMVQDMYDQMNYQATHDELTGLINRKEFERKLTHVLTDAKKHQSQHAACHMDLDQFKAINNACGHEAGDKLLKEISELLTTLITPPGVLARIGGDEFLFILKDHDIQSAKNFAIEINDAVSEHRFAWNNKTYTVGASIGIVSVDQASENVSSIINAADSARQSAKESGSNRVHVYEHNDKDQAIRNEVMDNMTSLNKAFDEERLKLRCQKINPTRLHSTEKPHYEILLSVEDELGIHLSPSEFIYAAERYNRMQTIDRWVIHNVFIWIKENSAKLNHINCLTINLSGHSLNDENLMEYILDELLASDLPRNKICFEVTETAAVKNLTDAVEVISELKDLGFKFALDDFGSGLSSYTHLKKIPVDYLKIDGAFVKGIADSPEDLAMVKSINEMAHLLGKQTIAEYVENAAVKEKLEQMGVDYVQGFHIEKPMPLDNLLQEHRYSSLAG